ncbi:MFS transporter [Cellulomonas sp. P22]|uniref:MFS transporter n=1 Tax=Cellulomonas sp. P22 TaxID=3373189 RepID=UPI0037B687E1
MAQTLTSRAETTPDSPAMNHREVLEALSGILLGMFVSVLATSVVSSSLPRVISDLKGTQSAFTWVVTATLLTTTISTPIWGKLADLLDRKVLIQLALAISVISSAVAGFSQSTEMLITMRAFQGIGAGGLTALGTVLIADIISPRERGRYMGLMGGIMGLASVGGPLIGGLITDGPGWRWNFFIGLPFAVAAIIVLQMTLHLPPMAKRKLNIDYAGAALLSVGIATLLLWVTFAGTHFDWVSWQSAAMVVGAVLVLAVAVWVESRATQPIIPLNLFRNRTLVLAVIASIAVGIAMFGTSVFLSQYMQIARGKSATASGLITIPMMLGVFLSSTISGRIISVTGRYKRYMIAGAATLTVGLALMGTIRYDTNFALVCLYMFVLGSGVGMLMQNLVLATQNTLETKDVGSGTSTVAFFRTLGGAMGVSVLGAVLGTKVTSLLASGLAALGIDTSVLGGSTSIPNVATIPEPVRTVVESAYGEAVAHLFLISVPLALVALIAVLFLREVPLGERSGVELRLAEEAAAAAAAPAVEVAVATAATAAEADEVGSTSGTAPSGTGRGQDD